MSATDQEVRKLYVNEELMIDSNKKLLFRDSGISIYSDSDGNLIIVADLGLTLDSNVDMATGHQFNAAADGVVTKSKAGTISDADFTTDTVGLIAIDTSNDRIYYRIGAGDWSYVSADGGFSFPEKFCSICKKKFKRGDILKMMVDTFDYDGAVHALPIHSLCAE